MNFQQGRRKGHNDSKDIGVCVELHTFLSAKQRPQIATVYESCTVHRHSYIISLKRHFFQCRSYRRTYHSLFITVQHFLLNTLPLEVPHRLRDRVTFKEVQRKKNPQIKKSLWFSTQGN